MRMVINHNHTVNGIPHVIELTYINKSFFREIPELNKRPLPIKGLDVRNYKLLPELDMNFYPFVDKKSKGVLYIYNPKGAVTKVIIE